MAGTTRVTFVVHAETGIGESLRLTGDVWSLGGFRPDRALELVTTPDTYPLWRTPRPVLLPTGRVTEYKYVLFKNKTTFDKWEPIQAHSRKLVPKGSVQKVEDQFGVYEVPPADELQSEEPPQIGSAFSRYESTGIARQNSGRSDGSDELRVHLDRVSNLRVDTDFQTDQRLTASPPTITKTDSFTINDTERRAR